MRDGSSARRSPSAEIPSIGQVYPQNLRPTMNNSPSRTRNSPPSTNCNTSLSHYSFAERERSIESNYGDDNPEGNSPTLINYLIT